MIKIDEKDMDVFREIAKQLRKMSEQLVELNYSVVSLRDEVRAYVTSQTIGKTRGMDTL